MGLAISLAFIVSPSAQATTYQRAPEARVFIDRASGYQARLQFQAYEPGFQGGGSIAIGDLGSDTINELITGAGPGGGPQVRLFRLNGTLINQFFAYDEAMHAGVNVAVADLDGDNAVEIITAPRLGGSPQVRVFDSFGRAKGTAGFFAYDEAYRGGVNIAAGDLTCDGKAEIVTGNGVDGAPHVRVFAGDGTWLGRDFQPFAESHRGGVAVAVGNVDGGCEAEIITAIQTDGQAWVKVYKYNEAKTIVGEWKALPDDVTTGINVAAGDVDGDRLAEVVVGVHSHGGSQVKVFEAYGKAINAGFFAYEDDFHGGVNLAVGSVALRSEKTSRPKAGIVTLPNRPKPEGPTSEARSVRVDLSEQRMYAYEYGYQVNTFLISSGLPRTPTPPGDYHIQRKIYSHLYSGPDYYLPNTLYNLQFRPGYYLHGAYWHNNFGHPMSHGCVNIHYKDAAWLYNWMQTGDLAVIEP